jgi:RNA polymerase sigma factor (sigma-70 family)
MTSAVEVDRWIGPLETEKDYAIFYVAYRLHALNWIRGKQPDWDSQTIEDVAHTAWESLYNKLGRIEHARAYLFRTLDSKLNDERRHRSRNQSHDLQSVELPGGSNNDPAHLVALPSALQEIKADLQAILLAVYQLPEGQRDAYRLKVSQHLGSAEIGDILGCSAAAVDTRVCRARATLAAGFSTRRIESFEAAVRRKG